MLEVCKRIPELYTSFFETLISSADLSSFTPWTASVGSIEFHMVEPGQAVLMPCALSTKDAEKGGL